MNRNHPLLKDALEQSEATVRFPSIQQHLRLNSRTNVAHEPVCWYVDKSPALTQVPVEKGQLYLFTFGLNERFGNFPQHPMFIPVVYNIALNSTRSTLVQSTLGLVNNLNIRLYRPINDLSKLQVIQADGASFIPQSTQQGNLLKIDTRYIHHNGHFRIVEDEVFSGLFSVNYNRKESPLNYYSADELEKIIGSIEGSKACKVIGYTPDTFADTLSNANEGKQLWMLFIILTLLFLLIESLIIRLWK